jgi:hypothetical protein
VIIDFAAFSPLQTRNGNLAVVKGQVPLHDDTGRAAGRSLLTAMPKGRKIPYALRVLHHLDARSLQVHRLDFNFVAEQGQQPHCKIHGIRFQER